MTESTTSTDASGLFRTARVLVVDDVATNVLLLERILQTANVGAINGLTDPRLVVETCRTFQPDLVMLDLHMPEMGGLEVLKAMREALEPDNFVPTIMLTADPSADAKEQALAAGAKDFVTKPFDRVEVLLRVRNLLETRTLYSRVKGQKAAIQAELDAKVADEERRAREHQVRSDRVSAVLADKSLNAVFQPICHISTNEVVGYEALARFQCLPFRPPNEWFDEADDVGLGLDLELLAIDRALEQFEQLDPSCFLSLNMSATTAVTSELHSRLNGSISDRVMVELTEHLLIDDYDAVACALAELRRRGVRIAVDDAGAGYAGLRQILRLEPDVIKLDLDLTRGISADRARQALTAAMVGLSRDLEATLVAEGVETKEDLDTLRDLGVCWGQGYFLGRPDQRPARDGQRSCLV